jgi:hypothetical protein
MVIKRWGASPKISEIWFNNLMRYYDNLSEEDQNQNKNLFENAKNGNQ